MRRSDESISKKTDTTKAKFLLAGGALFLSVLVVGSARSWDINVGSTAKAGDVQLPAGHYSITVEGSQAVFTPAGSGRTYNVPARLEKSTQKYDRTVVKSRMQGDTEVIDAVELGGTATTLEFSLPHPQSPETAPAPAPATLVKLNVAAADAKGQPVLDLSAADFRILDNGKPQTIASFHRREGFQASFAPLGPRQFSNRSASDIPHATMILFDLMNMRFEDRGYVITQLVHALQQFESGDNLYLYLITVDGRLYPVHGLPASAGDTAANDAAWPRDIQTKLTEAMQETSRQRPVDLNYYYPAALWHHFRSAVDGRGAPRRRAWPEGHRVDYSWLADFRGSRARPNRRVGRLLALCTPVEQCAGPR